MNCTMKGALCCKARDILEQINIVRNNARFMINKELLAPVVKYSIFTHENQSWIFCTETDKTGSRAKAGTHIEIDTGSNPFR
jgi:hypothetical protein